MEDKEKKLREINTQITARGIKLKDMEKECRQVEQRKITILSDIKGLQDTIKNLEKCRNELQQNVSGMEKVMKEKRYEIAGKLATIDQENKKIAVLWGRLINSNKVLEAKGKILEKKHQDLKAGYKKQAEMDGALSRRANALKKAQSGLDTEKEDFAKEKEESLRNIKVCEEKAQKNFDMRLLLKEKYDRKLSEVEKKKEENKKEEKNFKDKQKSSDIAKKAYEGKLKELQKEIASVKAGIRSNQKMKEALDAREKEIEIKDLRVKKIIRDKNIDKELKKLTKELT